MRKTIVVPKTIIVPLDGSRFAERALAPAHTLARQSDASLVLAMSRLGGVLEPERYLEATAEHEGIESVRTAVFTDLLAVTAIPMLADTEPDAIVCMATHGRTGAGLALFGSITDQVLRRIDVPLLLVGPEATTVDPRRYDTMIVCLDGSASADAILPTAMNLAQELDLDLCLVSVTDPDFATAGTAAPDIVESAPLQRTARQMQGRGVKVSWESLHGHDAATAIVEFAQTFRSPVIAMTTHGRSGLARVVAGSVTTAVVHDARCPVLVTRTRGLGA